MMMMMKAKSSNDRRATHTQTLTSFNLIKRVWQSYLAY